MPNATLQYQVLPKPLTAARAPHWPLVHQCRCPGARPGVKGSRCPYILLYSGSNSNGEGKEQPVVTSWLDRDGSAFTGLVGQHPRHCISPSLAPAGTPSQLSNLLTLGDNIVVYKVHAQDPTTEINKTSAWLCWAVAWLYLLPVSLNGTLGSCHRHRVTLIAVL